MNLAYSDPITNKVTLVAKWKIPFLIIHSYVWNFLRKPAVASWQNRVITIASIIKADLSSELLPELYDNMRQGCSSCRDLFGFLRGQPFTSEIEKALTKHRCETHYASYYQFHILHEKLFIESHELSDRICGFKSNRA